MTDDDAQLVRRLLVIADAQERGGLPNFAGANRQATSRIALTCPNRAAFVSRAKTC